MNCGEILLIVAAVTPTWNMPFALVSIVVSGLVAAIGYLFKIVLDEHKACKESNEALELRIDKIMDDNRRLSESNSMLWRWISKQTGKPVSQLKREVVSNDDDTGPA